MTGTFHAHSAGAGERVGGYTNRVDRKTFYFHDLGDVWNSTHPPLRMERG